MRNVLVICICLVAAYCVDRNYYGGLYTSSLVEMIGHVDEAY